MQEAYINTGDLIIVDTSIEPQNEILQSVLLG